MDTEQAFIRTICENPHDVSSRLIYADWLEEHGQPKKAALHREPCAPFERSLQRQYQVLKRHVALSFEGLFEGRYRLDLASAHLYANRTSLDGFCDTINCSHWHGRGRSQDVTCVVRYGFVSEVICSTLWFTRCAGELFRRHPITQVVLYKRFPGGMEHRYFWGRAAKGVRNPSLHFTLPRNIFDWLPQSGRQRKPIYFIPTISTAMRHLSQACVWFGRHQAGLPALPMGRDFS